MTLRKLVSVILTAAVLFSLVACNRNNNTKTNSETNAGTQEEKVNLKADPVIKIWSHIQDSILDEFAIDYPEFTVQRSEVIGVFEPNKAEDLKRLAGAVAAEDQPDAFMCMMTPAEAYYSNLFQPIQKYLEQDEYYNIEDIDEGAFDLTTFNDIIYFIPVDFTIGILAWNRELMEKAGLDPDTPPKTWNEFIDMCQQAVTTDASGKIATIGIETLPWENWHAAAFGKHYVDETGLNFNWDTKEFLEVMELARDIHDTYGGRDKLSNPGDYRFVFKNVLFTGYNGAALNSLVNFNIDFNFDNFPSYDGSEPPYVPAHIGASYGIPKGAKNPAGGWKIATYHVTDGRRKNEYSYFTDNPTGYIPGYNIHKPSREKIYEEFEPHMEPELIERMRKRDELESRRNFVIYTSAVESKLKMYIQDEMPKMLNHEIAPKDFLKNLQSYSEALIKEFKEQKIGEGWTFEDGKTGIPPDTEQ